MADLSRLLHDLSQTAACTFPVPAVEVRQTHISVVFLAGDWVYKVKKPVRLPFLDFSTLEKRAHFCREEVRLNRRLAPGVYDGVVPVTEGAAGLCFEGNGEVVDWAVKMQRLPEEATFEQRLLRDELSVAMVQRLAKRIAAFHADAEPATEFGGFGTVAENARANLQAALQQVDLCLSRAVLQRLQKLQEQHLAMRQPLIEQRTRLGMNRDTHGDLHLDHVYGFPERSPPHDLVIIDCIEFNPAFRQADPVADMAFAFMDFCFHGRRDLAMAFAETYFTASDDWQGRELLAFYSAYRAMVRGKVEGITQSETEIPKEKRAHAHQLSQAHWLLALVELAEPLEKPCLVLVGGLPGTGKSTLARSLADRANFQLIRSDVVRKELAGLAEHSSASTEFGTGLYTPDWDERVYQECLRRAQEHLWVGGRVLMDASFRSERFRGLFLDAAVQWGVPGRLLLCQAPLEVLRERIAGRRGDASDADGAILQAAAQAWEPLHPATQRRTEVISAELTPEEVAAQAHCMLKEWGLA